MKSTALKAGDPQAKRLKKLFLLWLVIWVVPWVCLVGAYAVHPSLRSALAEVICREFGPYSSAGFLLHDVHHRILKVPGNEGKRGCEVENQLILCGRVVCVDT